MQGRKWQGGNYRTHDAGTLTLPQAPAAKRCAFYAALAGAVDTGAPRFPPAFLGRLAGSIGDILMRSQRISNRRFREVTGWKPVYPSIRAGAATLRLA